MNCLIRSRLYLTAESHNGERYVVLSDPCCFHSLCSIVLCVISDVRSV